MEPKTQIVVPLHLENPILQLAHQGLTIMCQTTRNPAAYPLRSINTNILKALTNLSIFGIPKQFNLIRVRRQVCREFSKALHQLQVSHNISSAYHPQSQGALERFHQTLKSLKIILCET